MAQISTQADITRALERRRAAAAAQWQDREEVVLIAAGEPILKPGRDDIAYRFDAHSDYFYLTDRNQPDGVLAFDPADGWVDFSAPVTVEDRLWSGAVDDGGEGPTTAQLADWLAARSARALAWLGSPPSWAQLDASLSQDLRFGLMTVRRPKDEVELERMAAANLATLAAFNAVLPLLAEGVSEREAQVELESTAFRNGAEAMGYDTIIGGGTNSAVLHFAPSSRRFGAGELVLIDAGAQCLGYTSDVTRTYAVGGTLSPVQQEIHSIVYRALVACTERCRPGVEWRDIHLTAALTIAEGLVAMGLLKGEPSSLVESGATWLFFPHGIGHLVGLGVRDAGGMPLRERGNDPRPYPNLRIDLPLEPGYVVTVEPGVYFVPAILEDPEHRRKHRDSVNWDEVDKLIRFGGVRIENDVVITEDGHEVTTGDVPMFAA
ncbi:MAG: aminopeptidase P N-terminal domain-containing protein [Mycobacterium sp.]